MSSESDPLCPRAPPTQTVHGVTLLAAAGSLLYHARSADARGTAVGEYDAKRLRMSQNTLGTKNCESTFLKNTTQPSRKL